jgi:hypothetical protein
MRKTIRIPIYYVESGKKKIIDKESMVDELETKIAELVESGEYDEA